MKRFFVYVLLITFSVGSLISCSKPDEISKMVPSDASVVVHINAGSLSKKLSWKEIQSTNWFKELNTEASDSLAKVLLADPSKSGVDSEGDFVFFVTKEGNKMIVAVQGKLKDEAAFEAINKQAAKGAATITDGEYKTIALENNGVVTWKDNRFCYYMNSPETSAPQFDAEGNMSEPAPALSTDSLRLMVKALFELDGDNSLGKNKRFSSLIKEDGDVHLWMNTGSLYSDLGAGMLSMMRLNVLFEGNVSATTLNFDNGKITMKSKQYYGEEMTKLIEKYSPKPIDADIINRIPSKNVFGAFVMNYPPEGLKEFLKLIGVDGMVNAYLGEAGYSIDEFIRANKGEMVLAFSDLSMEQKQVDTANVDGGPVMRSATTPDMKFLFSTSINDKAAFDKLIAKIQSTIPQEATAQISEKLTYKLDNNWFVASNSPEYVTNFLASNNNKLAFTDKISGHPFGGYIDIQKLMIAAGKQTDSSAQSALDASMKTWQDVVFYGGEIKDGAMISYGEVNMIDKNTNSLKQLNQYADVMAASYKNRKKQAPELQPEIEMIEPTEE